MSGKKEEVIKAAIRVFAQKGTEAGSIADVAREAGLSKSSVFFYFTNKQQLLEEVYDYCNRVCSQYLEKDIDECENTIEKLVKRFVNTMNFIKAHRVLATLISMYAISPKSEVYSTDELNEHYTRILEIVRQGQDKNEIIQEDSEVVANAYYGFSLQNYMTALKKPELLSDDFIQANCRYIRSTFKL